MMPRKASRCLNSFFIMNGIANQIIIRTIFYKFISVTISIRVFDEILPRGIVDEARTVIDTIVYQYEIRFMVFQNGRKRHIFCLVKDGVYFFDVVWQKSDKTMDIGKESILNMLIQMLVLDMLQRLS